MKHSTPSAAGPLLTAVAAAALLAFHPWASAFSLGRMTVQSALGEPLRAEIEVSNLSPDEAASLRTSIASSDAFRAAGVDFNAVLSGAQASLQRRSDGRPVIRLSGERTVSEPFVDVILDFSWTGGRLQRSYTLLIDPPTRTAAAAPPAPVAAAPVFSPAPAPVSPPVAQAPARAPSPPPAPVVRPAPPPTATAPRSEGDNYRVRNGDTLSTIANAHSAAGVSLDQMLVSLYRGNPQAFVGNNMNRLKAGVLLALPDGATAGSVEVAEARGVIQAHSADFAAFRRRLAEAVPAIKSTEPARQTTGKVEAAVQDRKPGNAASAPDQLTLSRSAVKPGTTEAKISKEAERKAAETRVAELSRNVEELKRLSAGAAATPNPAPAAAAKPGLPVPVAAAPTAPPVTPPAPAAVAKPVPVPASAPVLAAASAVAPTVLAAASQAASVATAAASAPVAVAAASAPKPPVKPPAPVSADASEGWLDSVSSNPFVGAAVVAVLALLAGLGVMRLRRRNQDGPSETSFVESKLQPDSFFGVSGGQRVDTRDGAGNSSSSSLSYSLSQLDAIGDVDPVAEADVYLAYGRDLQAEEILKEALRSEPGRVAVRSKLLEVYGKRADTRNFETQARQLYEMTGGEGEEWDKAQDLGRQIDPQNELYKPAGPIQTVDIDTGSEPPPDLRADAEPEVATVRPLAPILIAEPVAAVPSGYDLDIDLDATSTVGAMEATRPLGGLGDPVEGIGRATAPAPLPLSGEWDALSDEPPLEIMHTGMEPLPDLGLLDEPATDTVRQAASPLDFDFGELSLDLDQAPKAQAEAPSTDAALADGPTLRPEFEPVAVPAAEPTTESGSESMSFDLEGDDADPLQRKIELADEFRRIGDVEGARDLLDEVLSKAAGLTRDRAKAMLDELG